MHIKKLAATALAALLLAAPLAAEAVAPNPFATQSYVPLEGEAEEAYISQRINELYFGGELLRLTAPAPYEADKRWSNEQREIAGVSTDIFRPRKAAADRVVLFLHGGAYLGGQNNLYRDWGMHLGMLAGNAVTYMPDYAHTPGQKHPAAINDAVAVYQALQEQGIPTEKIVLIGDSAGGHLALVMLQRLRELGIQLPGRMVLISPWADVSLDLPSRQRNLGKDQILNTRNPVLLETLKNPPYFEGASRRDPLVSPLYMDMQGLPPTLITAGTKELLLDDAVLLQAYMQAAGVDARLRLYRGMSHDWTIMLPELKETRRMFDDIRIFLKESTH